MEFGGMGRSIQELEESVTPHDGHITTTYDEQDEVEEQILDLFKMFMEQHGNTPNMPLLAKEKHSSYLRRGLYKFSSNFEALDCSQPWLCYWILHAMNLLDLKLSHEEKSQVTTFLSSCQSPEGGFAGGPKQLPHLAASYAAINACVSLECPESLAVINRERLLEFVVNMKMSDGSFRMHRGGEVDVRAVYCAVVVIKLTNACVPPTLFQGTAEWIIRCQTYEGGFGGFPGMEAHGGYTFCAVAALILLGQEKLMNAQSLLKWLSFKQLSLEGGFSGRTNKLVDGCYSFWQGATFALLSQSEPGDFVTNEGSWLFHQTALQEYILICCQHSQGGLIDKPGKPRDFYHTCYTLSGLSIAQQSQGGKSILGNSTNLLRPVVPVFNLTLEAVAKAQEYFYELEPNVTNTASVITLEEDEGIDCDGGGGDAGAERVQLQKSK